MTTQIKVYVPATVAIKCLYETSQQVFSFFPLQRHPNFIGEQGLVTFVSARGFSSLRINYLFSAEDISHTGCTITIHAALDEWSHLEGRVLVEVAKLLDRFYHNLSRLAQ